jgi:hypothetical protein
LWRATVMRPGVVANVYAFEFFLFFVHFLSSLVFGCSVQSWGWWP